MDIKNGSCWSRKKLDYTWEQAIDAGQDELGSEAKKYLASGEATKGNASAMIDKLKSALS